MHKFKDTEGREWGVEIDCFTVDRLRKDTPYDLLNHECVIKLTTDLVESWKVLWHLVEEQSAQLNVSPQQFAKLIRPPALSFAARDALFKECIDFFLACQSPDKALAVEEMWAAVLAAVAEFDQRSKAERPAIQHKRNALIQTKLQSTFGGLAASLDKMLCEEAALSASSGMPPKAQGSA